MKTLKQTGIALALSLAVLVPAVQAQTPAAAPAIDQDAIAALTRIDIDVDRRGGYHGGCCYHPVATAAAVTATAMVTAAVIGSMVNTLPPSCSTVIVNGFAYQQCGNTWYQPQLSDSSTTYVVINAPR